MRSFSPLGVVATATHEQCERKIIRARGGDAFSAARPRTERHGRRVVSQKQKQARLRAFARLHDAAGVPPSMRELAKAWGVGVRAVEDYLGANHMRSLVVDPRGKSRARVLTRLGRLYAFGATGDVQLPTRTADGAETYVQPELGT
jgi:hypothetical protein